MSSPDSTSSATNFFDITPHDTNALAHNTRGIYVGTAGDVKVDGVESGTVIFRNLAAGVLHPIAARRVYLTGTTATDILGAY